MRLLYRRLSGASDLWLPAQTDLAGYGRQPVRADAVVCAFSGRARFLSLRRDAKIKLSRRTINRRPGQFVVVMERPVISCRESAASFLVHKHVSQAGAAFF
ncbi:hypothetical protein KCP70_17495 [Salmonella enterica subsp. enterica]|nr:hypothetical protein KCP70_17495 [Salmonella enterica subsp. enterica]